MTTDAEQFTPWEYMPFFEVGGIPVFEKLKSTWAELAEELANYEQNPRRIQQPYLLDIYSGQWLLGVFRSDETETSYFPIDKKRAVIARTRPREVVEEDSAVHRVFDEILQEGLAQNRALCPKLTSILEPLVPDGLVMYNYSTLKPGAKILPHRGSDAGNVRVHLCLREARGCWLKVLDQTRTWRNGEVWGFDDAFTHSVEHNGDHDRTVVIMDFKKDYMEQELRRVAQLRKATA